MKALTKFFPASVLGYIALIVILTAGAAQSLTGTNTVDSGDIVNGAVKTIDIRANAVTSSRIANGGVFGADVADNSLKSVDVADNSLTGADVADGSVTGSDVSDNTVTGADVAANTLTSDDIDESTLEIPAAQAVGSLNPPPIPPGKYVFSGNGTVNSPASVDNQICIGLIAGSGISSNVNGSRIDLQANVDQVVHTNGSFTVPVGSTASLSLRCGALTATTDSYLVVRVGRIGL